MVDCIVPATGPNELALVRDFGIVDNVPVTHESFRQWVIEDKFCSGRPEWDKVGVTFTNDVKAFELQKLRILNAGHQIIATVGELLSIVTISDTMKHPLIMDLFSKIQTEEIVPHVLAVPGMTPLEYIKLIKRRFSNTEIIDTTRRVAFDGSSRHPGFLHPIIRDAIAADKPIEGLALIEALWARMCFGVREDGSLIEANDPFWSELRMAAYSAIEFPEVWLSQVQFYGDLGQDTRFAKCFTKWLNLVWEQGTEIAVQIYLES
jgi:mannitol 2-dehydrogenase